MELKIVDTVDSNVIACTISKLPELFLGMGKQQARSYVRMMEGDPEYSDGVIRPTQKTTLVFVDRFIDFMKEMETRKFN